MLATLILGFILTVSPASTNVQRGAGSQAGNAADNNESLPHSVAGQHRL